MLEHGVSERWPSRHCEHKWRELLSNSAMPTNNNNISMAQFSSPGDTTVGYNWMHFQ